MQHARQDELAAEFERLYAEIARRARPIRFEPNADVWLSDDGATVVAVVEIAGVDPPELRVGIDDNLLYIVGRRNDRERPPRGTVLMKEIEYGEFAKKIYLPSAVDHEGATAAYGDGLLTVKLPVSRHQARGARCTELHMIVRRITA
jgi:HSP20 family protein